MKKVLALLLILVMVLSFGACAKQETPAATTAPPVKTAAPTATVAPTPKAPAGPEVLQDVRVRKALSLAIDRDYLNETVWNNSRVAAYALVPIGVPDATAGSDFRKTGKDLMGTDYAANVKEAQKLLEEAGFPKGAGFPELEFSFNTNTGHQAVAEAIQNMWKENLGITVKLASMEWDVFQGYRKTNDCQIARQGWLGDYTDPSTFFDLFLSDAGTNDGHYKNTKYDELVKGAKKEADPAKRMTMYHQAETILMNDMPMIPIVFYADDVLSQTDFTGYGVTGTGNKMFWNASKPEVTACVGGQPETLDPTMNQSVDGMIYTTHLFEGLYRIKTDGSFELGQAKEVKIEGTKITAILRDDIFWTDGKPVTAYDFEYSFRRLVDPATASPYGYLGGEFFKNGNDVLGGTVTPDKLTVKAIDDKTLEFEIIAQVPYLADMLAFPNLMPLREDIVSKNPEGWATNVKTLVTNGRYKIKTIANEDKLVMVKNEKYWDAASTTVTTVTFKLMSDDNAILAAFKNKEIDLADSFPSDELAALEKTAEFHRYGNIGLYYIQLNNTATATK
ncbi:MAG: ABC transporter substrate-binding protein [Christensenellales bacterium]